LPEDERFLSAPLDLPKYQGGQKVSGQIVEIFDPHSSVVCDETTQTCPKPVSPVSVFISLQRLPEGPIFSSSDERYHNRNRANAETVLFELLQGPFQKLQELMGTYLPIKDALSKKETGRTVPRLDTNPKRIGSQHFYGRGIDIYVGHLTNEERGRLVRFARELGFTGFGYGQNVLHLDVRPLRRRQGLVEWIYLSAKRNPKLWFGVTQRTWRRLVDEYNEREKRRKEREMKKQQGGRQR